MKDGVVSDYTFLANHNSIKSKGQRTNPLIHFDQIRGLAVGLVRRYPLICN